MATGLVRYDAMCHAIEAAYKVDEVKDIRDRAKALQEYNRQAQNWDAEDQACQIRLRAERKAGKLLAEMRAKGEREGRGGDRKSKSHDATLIDQLDDLGISKKQSSDWQKLAAIPQREFDAELRSQQRPTTAGIIRAFAEPMQKPVADDAVWVWGRLRDFEVDGLLDRDPTEVIETLTSRMKDEVHVRAPRVAAWLKRIGGTK
jgi:hypothetical protein